MKNVYQNQSQKIPYVGSIFIDFEPPKKRPRSPKMLQKSILEASWKEDVAKMGPIRLQESPQTPFRKQFASIFEYFGMIFARLFEGQFNHVSDVFAKYRKDF